MNNLKRTWATDYTVVSNTLINCFDVEPMTRFLCIFLAAQADNFQFNNAILCRAMNCTEATLRKYMKEALALGLIERKRKTVNGRFGFFDYTLIDPTTLQNLPDGKKTKVEKNQGGKTIRLNKEEYYNKEEYSNKEESAALREDADPIDLAFEQTAPVTQKEKSSAKKEKAVTPETAAKRDAFIAEMRGKTAQEPDEPIDVVTDTLRWLTEDPSGKNNWQMIRRTVAAKPEELTDPAATVTSAALMLGTGVTSVPSQFRRRLLGFARTQLKIDRQNSQTPTHVPRNNYSRQPAQPVITREQSVRVAEKILAKRAAARQGVE